MLIQLPYISNIKHIRWLPIRNQECHVDAPVILHFDWESEMETTGDIGLLFINILKYTIGQELVLSDKTEVSW